MFIYFVLFLELCMPVEWGKMRNFQVDLDHVKRTPSKGPGLVSELRWTFGIIAKSKVQFSFWTFGPLFFNFFWKSETWKFSFRKKAHRVWPPLHVTVSAVVAVIEQIRFFPHRVIGKCSFFIYRLLVNLNLVHRLIFQYNLLKR